ncbi:MAG: hypothetical protein QXY62_01410 [Candidatus Altiarchaeota archaeon]
MATKEIKKEHGVIIGLLGSLIASSCCLGPIILIPLFIILGIGSISIATSFGKYKTLLTIFGAVLVLIAILIYLKRREGICNLKTIWDNRYFIILTILTYIISSLMIIYLIAPIIAQIIFENLK